MDRYLAPLSGCLFGALLLGGTAMAVVVDSTPRTLAQPGGATFTAIKHGDEYLSWVARPDGRPIAKAKDGTWFYVSKYVDGNALISNYPAHGSPPEGQVPIPRHRSADPDMLGSLSGIGRMDSFDESHLVRGSHEGNVLIIIVEFSDQTATFDASDWASRISGEPEESRSIIDYYNAASYGKATLAAARESHGVIDNGVIGPISLQRSHPDLGAVGASNQATTINDEIYLETIAAVDPFIDFATFDANGDGIVRSSELSIVLVLAGYENAYSVNSPSTNAHARTSGSPLPVEDTGQNGSVILDGTYAMVGEIADGNRPNSLGVLVHELGHLTFGLPDLYDRNNDLQGNSGGIGGFGVMDQGAHGRDPTRDAFAGETPTLPSAWSQYKLGWVNTTSNFRFGGLTTSTRPAPLVHDIQVGIAHIGVGGFKGISLKCYAKQYFLMQYRTAEGYDRGLSALIGQLTGTEYDGVVIYHVDERRSNNDTASAKLLDVEEAATPYLSHSEQAATHHLWGIGTQTRFGPLSTPNSNGVNPMAVSSVSIEVGARQSIRTNNGRIRSIDVNINSLCD